MNVYEDTCLECIYYFYGIVKKVCYIVYTALTKSADQ